MGWTSKSGHGGAIKGGFRETLLGRVLIVSVLATE